MYLSSTSYTHGERRLIRDLGEAGCDDPRLKDDRLEAYRETTASALAMATEVGARTVAAAGVSPDFVVYATESTDAEDALVRSARLADGLGCPGSVVMSVAGHGCGNLGLLLHVADGLLGTSRAASVLLITSDRVVSRPRIMADGLSVLSDGAAATLASREAPPGGSPGFLVHGLAMSCDWNADPGGDPISAQKRSVRLGRSAAAALRSASGHGPREFTRAIFSNYRYGSQRFLAGAAGFAPAQLLTGPTDEYAHCFAADLLVNCDLLATAGAFALGDRLALSATGPHTWAMVDLEVVALPNAGGEGEEVPAGPTTSDPTT
ncbi:hypothetical protein I0C86_09565 [Plantactinospora sp. S1510]|uniref:3-oxoacyl-ACP synthase n=1 Tax=Plantactinospora alkalitolerans TaxID=2789879 RepID=A0ABS0GSQ1_9ACTN|nr:hypothetical protein [Plantactinospora alkalitolerans]MBF9129221.1 hypothetical protein [Plantactinospora alkalitolerans]